MNIIIQGSFPGGRPYQSVLNHSTLQLNPNIRGNNIAGNNFPVQLLNSNRDKNVFGIDASRLKLSGVGSPLPNEVLQKMERLFRTDFKNVRIYTNGGQAESIGALAFAAGNNIYFAKGQYNPGTSYGQRLLGHELTHVVQQRNGRVKNPYGSGIAVVQDPRLEVEADRNGLQAALQPKMSSINNFSEKDVLQPYDPYTIGIGAGIFALGLIGTYALSKIFGGNSTDNKKSNIKIKEKTVKKKLKVRNIKSTPKRKNKEPHKEIVNKSNIKKIVVPDDIEKEPEIIITQGNDDDKWEKVTTKKKIKIKLTPEEQWERDFNFNIDQIENLLTSSINKYPVYTKKEKPEREGCVKAGPSYSVDPKELREDVYDEFKSREGKAYGGGYIHIVEKSSYYNYNITLHKKYKAANPKTMVNLHIS